MGFNLSTSVDQLIEAHVAVERAQLLISRVQ